ncbi:MAG: Methyltransferase type 11 [Deltaproteobacteria bacterium]|nr:Methyltransferase type 11 [Deltaproteobacteria bacterium]
MLTALKNLHHKYVFQRRIDVLAKELAAHVPANSKVLDVGCGDGTISQLVMAQRPGVTYEGIDIMARPSCAIPFRTFDGLHIPHDDGSFDAVQFVDVLHHTNEIEPLVADAVRVSKRYVLIKDHLWENRLDFETLRFMDWVGNAPHGVKVIYNFKNEEFWRDLFDRLGLSIVTMNKRVPLYPFPFSALFGRGLHFVALLEKRSR